MRSGNFDGGAEDGHSTSNRSGIDICSGNRFLITFSYGHKDCPPFWQGHDEHFARQWQNQGNCKLWKTF
jgi:hypothetical protein